MTAPPPLENAENGGETGWDHDADRWLVARVREGHTDAFEVLLRRHQDRVYRIALRMLGDSHDAEDVAQDVAVQLWRVLASFSGASAFSTWLYRVVVNRCLNHQRRGRSRPDTRAIGEADHPSTAGPEDRVISAARLEATTRAVASLPPEQRSVFVLHQIEGLPYREVAAIVGISEAAVRSRLERARKNLLHALREWT